MVKPLVILNQAGAVFDLAAMDGKAYGKSLENGELWHYHQETRRVLPYRGPDGGENGAPLEEILENEGWYLARVKIGPDVLAKAAGGQQKRQTPPESPSGLDAVSGGEDSAPYEVLARLGQTIASRRKTLPEGSYTTHLFSSGPEKIRKKLGEEAVEVILASSKEDLIYEAADLVFHLMVLLESEDLSLQDILDALKKRE